MYSSLRNIYIYSVTVT